MSSIRPESVTPNNPSFMPTEELLDAAKYYLYRRISLPVEWQLVLLARLQQTTQSKN